MGNAVAMGMGNGNKSDVQVSVCVCVCGGVQMCTRCGITNVRRQISAVFGLVSYWMQLQTAKRCRLKGGGGDCCVWFVCPDEKMYFMKLEVPDCLAPESYCIRLSCLLSNCMWCTVNRPSQVSFSHLLFLLF